MEIVSSIEINASAEKVWQVLTDVDHYPDWNPFITKVIGVPTHGQDLEITIHPPESRSLTFFPKVLNVEEGKELRWKGRLFFDGIFDGEHVFEIEPINDQKVRFTQREHFSGFFVRFFGRALGKTRLGFEEMNQALKREAETRSCTLS